MYPMLVGAGLGKKKIEFSSSDKHDDVVKRITDVYPRLAKCGGFTLHKSQDGRTKRPLQEINIYIILYNNNNIIIIIM